MSETNEIMVNNEEAIEEVTEEIASKSSGKGLKIAAGVGLTILIGGLAVKYVVLPTVAKIKAKKQNSGVVDTEFTELDGNEEQGASDSEEPESGDEN